MANFFDRMLGRNNKEGSSTVAKSRLKVVLVHDRINLPPERLREMQEEILAVIARYVPVDPDEIAIMLEQPDRNSGRLVAQIPFGKGIYPAEKDFSDYTEDDDLKIEAEETLQSAIDLDNETAGDETSEAVSEEVDAASDAEISAVNTDAADGDNKDDEEEKPVG